MADTRAALERLEEMSRRSARAGAELSAKGMDDLAALCFGDAETLDEAITALAHAAPEERGEGEADLEAALRATLDWFRERGYTDAPIYRYFEERASETGRCPVCGWPFAESREHGCVPGDCSYRPAEGTDEYRRIRARRAALASHPVQGAGGGEREVVQWPRGYTVRIAVEALEGVSVCASLSEQDPDGAWVVIHEVTELPTVDAALRALASGEPAPPPLPQRMECPYCLAVWRPHSVADAECCPSCLRDLPRLAPPSAQQRDG